MIQKIFPVFVNNTRQVLNIIHDVNHPDFRYQYDIYHMQIMEGNIATTIKNNLNNIGHIQLADNPGRHEPGTGEINYPWLLDYIDQLGYQGGLVANIYHPRPRWKVYAGSKTRRIFNL